MLSPFFLLLLSPSFENIVYPPTHALSWLHLSPNASERFPEGSQLWLGPWKFFTPRNTHTASKGGRSPRRRAPPGEVSSDQVQQTEGLPPKTSSRFVYLPGCEAARTEREGGLGGRAARLGRPGWGLQLLIYFRARQSV